ncbi:MAG: hypothetical protein N2C14_13650 [Planctomycetales bacterium]
MSTGESWRIHESFLLSEAEDNLAMIVRLLKESVCPNAIAEDAALRLTSALVAARAIRVFKREEVRATFDCRPDYSLIELDNPKHSLWRDERLVMQQGRGKELLDRVLHKSREIGREDRNLIDTHLALEDALIQCISKSNDPNPRVQVIVDMTPEKLFIRLLDENGENLFPPNDNR